jgi:hypothetical protein
MDFLLWLGSRDSALHSGSECESRSLRLVTNYFADHDENARLPLGEAQRLQTEFPWFVTTSDKPTICGGLRFGVTCKLLQCAAYFSF